MKKLPQTAIHSIAAYALFTGAGAAFAHDGHGLLGSHWHATDVLGFVALAGVIGLAVWLSGGKK